MINFLAPVRIGMFIRMPRLKDWKNVFKFNSKNIKQAIAIQVTCNLEIRQD